MNGAKRSKEFDEPLQYERPELVTILSTWADGKMNPTAAESTYTTISGPVFVGS